MENNPTCFIREPYIYFNSESLPPKSRIMEKLGVRKNSFAGKMISDFYDYNFENGINLRMEYKKYYEKEFKLYEDFLEIRFNIPLEIITRIKDSNYSILDYKKRIIDDYMESLNNNNEFTKMFSDIIGGYVNENPDGLYY